MRRIIRNLHFYTRSERRGIFLLCCLIVAVGATGLWISRQKGHRPPMLTQTDSAARHSLDKPPHRSYRASRAKETKGTRESKHRSPFPMRVAEARLHPFNPNDIDSIGLRQLGLPPWVARNVVRYRQRGGRFRQASDFKKIYGLSEGDYKALLPYIDLPAHAAPYERLARDSGQVRLTADSELTADERLTANGRQITHGWLTTDSSTTRKDSARLLLPDSLRHPPIVKYAPGTVVSLNQADTTELKKIPGIGSYIAARIVNYRQQLGDYYCLEQLRDIHIDHLQLADWLHVEPELVKRLPVNTCSLERLNRHPYINFYQARAIVEWRKLNGPLHNLKVLALDDSFTAADIEKISHYVSFETAKE